MDLNDDLRLANRPTVRQWMVRHPRTTRPTNRSSTAPHDPQLYWVSQITPLEAKAWTGSACGFLPSTTSTARASCFDSFSTHSLVDDVWCSSMPVIAEDASLEVAVQRLLQNGTAALSVVDVNGRRVGTISVVELLCATFAEPTVRAHGPSGARCTNAF